MTGSQRGGISPEADHLVWDGTDLPFGKAPDLDEECLFQISFSLLSFYSGGRHQHPKGDCNYCEHCNATRPNRDKPCDSPQP